MTFYSTAPPFLQDFCKKAQWRAKKLRERGSNAARQARKGWGGSPDSVVIRPQSVVIRSWFADLPLVVSCRFGRFRSRFGRVDALPTHKTRRKDGKTSRKTAPI